MAGWTLGRAAGDFFSYVQLFQQAPADQRADGTALRSRLMGLLEEFAKHPQARAASPVELEEARFALVAFADEMILRTDWDGRSDWLADTLQLQLFRTNRGGDEFFERLARLRAENTDAREIFFLCLVFGMEGQYADRDSERRALITQQFEMLRVAGRAADVATVAPVTPTAYEVEIQLPGQRQRSVWRPIVTLALLSSGVFAVLLVVLYLLGGRVPAPGV